MIEIEPTGERKLTEKEVWFDKMKRCEVDIKAAITHDDWLNAMDGLELSRLKVKQISRRETMLDGVLKR